MVQKMQPEEYWHPRAGSSPEEGCRTRHTGPTPGPATHLPVMNDGNEILSLSNADVWHGTCFRDNHALSPLSPSPLSPSPLSPSPLSPSPLSPSPLSPSPLSPSPSDGPSTRSRPARHIGEWFETGTSPIPHIKNSRHQYVQNGRHLFLLRI
jgi:hypothetical protein